MKTITEKDLEYKFEFDNLNGTIIIRIFCPKLDKRAAIAISNKTIVADFRYVSREVIKKLNMGIIFGFDDK